MSDIEIPTDDELLIQQRAAVAAFLEYDPDFFRHYPQLVNSVQVTHEERGTVSLVDIQLTRLRSRVAELEEDITALMSQARRNETLFRQLGEVQLKLLRASNITAARHALQKMADQLSLQVTLRLFADPCPRHQLAQSEYAQTRVAQHAKQQVYLGRLARHDAQLLLDQPPELGSFAVLPINTTPAAANTPSEPMGVLVFASPDGGHFQPSMDTLFLDQMVELLGALIPKWLVEASQHDE
uniref:DUF484 family protein n=1 Tax=Thaumasiovibrio occultus TaxID=1891184 RepID=UPI000B35BEAB|nr:DUF484 family protein [Thaumasiovibrio occultus]